MENRKYDANSIVILTNALVCIQMVGAAGFEPTTTCAQGRCATRLRYAPKTTKK